MIPHEYIEALGYKKNIIGKDNNYDVIDWTHETLPMLKEDCYVYLEKDFKNYSETSDTFRILCERIGCEVPAEFNESYLESRFKKDMSIIKKSLSAKEQELVKKLMEIKDEDGNPKFSDDYISNFIARKDDPDTGTPHYSFYRGSTKYGLFNRPEGEVYNSGLILASFGTNNDHLDKTYMKECCELAALIDGLHILELTWGETTYYRQDIDYNSHINFLEECLDLVKEKKKEVESED